MKIFNVIKHIVIC